METRYDDLMARLRDAAQPDRDPPPEFVPYLDKVRLNAYEIVDRDVHQLKKVGFSEDEIFEQTVSAAVAAGCERLAAALGTLE